MTKQEFWRLIANCIESCGYCPVQIEGKTEGCIDNCSESLSHLYERLECKSLNNYGSNNSNARKDFMDIVYDELSDDEDNLRANRIIDAADDYADSFKECESNDG